MKHCEEFEFNFNAKKSNQGWVVRCPKESDYGFKTAEECHLCFIDAMALNNKTHQGHNCKEGHYYRELRAQGQLI